MPHPRASITHVQKPPTDSNWGFHLTAARVGSQWQIFRHDLDCRVELAHLRSGIGDVWSGPPPSLGNVGGYVMMVFAPVYSALVSHSDFAVEVLGE